MSPSDTKEVLKMLQDIREEVVEIRTQNRIDHARIEKVEERMDAFKSFCDQMVGAKSIIVIISSALGALIMVLVNWLLSKH